MKTKDKLTSKTKTPTIYQKFKLYFFLTLLFSALFLSVSVILIAVDDLFFDNSYQVHYFLKSDCDYKIPDEYEIVFSKQENKYAVCYNTSYGKEYLKWHPLLYISGGFWFSDLDSSKPTMLIDSCDAKALLKEYFKSKEPKVKDFK